MKAPRYPSPLMLLQRNLRRLRSACSGAALLCGFCTCAQADCFDAASHYHQVNPLVLRAIAWAESHNEPLALHQNPNGTTDYGVMQINSVHLSALGQYGISTQTLMQPCSNVYVAAWHLRHQMDKYGNTLAAVGAYHSETPELRDRYALRIVQILKDWKLVREVP